MKILDNLRDGYKILKNNSISSYKIDSEILMSQTLEISREELILNLEKKINLKEKEKYFNFINRRKKNEPIAYILNEKERSGRAKDPVAHFHLTNGALVERLCWKGNTSEVGMSRSYGLMVNYLYRLDKIEENHESYTGEGKIKASSRSNRLLKN